MKLIGIGVAVGVTLWIIKGTAIAGAKAVGEAINPTNPDNVFARGVDAVGDFLDDGADDDSFSLGGAIFDFFNGSPKERIEESQRRAEIDR